MPKRSIKGATKGLVLRNPVMREYPVAFRALFQNAVSSAVYRSVSFELTPAQFHALATSPCHYCGAPPGHRIFGSMRYTGKYNGVDRLDSKGPYSPANTVPACKICNRIKYVSTVKEYLDHARRIVAFQETKA